MLALPFVKCSRFLQRRPAAFARLQCSDSAFSARSPQPGQLAPWLMFRFCRLALAFDRPPPTEHGNRLRIGVIAVICQSAVAFQPNCMAFVRPGTVRGRALVGCSGSALIFFTFAFAGINIPTTTNSASGQIKESTQPITPESLSSSISEQSANKTTAKANPKIQYQ